MEFLGRISRGRCFGLGGIGIGGEAHRWGTGLMGFRGGYRVRLE